ncbi:MATH domain and coiled-coil domain-containing protein At3g58210-like isoform X2 [Rosa chinensis]|uniref:MATH domain and coiled-coil domain-containing protein At3g58210-like isoform X2 n=1 Tax=Rosa chinensis TaxID=74649 RepID=UPI001AD8D0F0|nr:MATH domain and coiled-coil domain-containing protein At3g58210-like isoform X2 [Rosa chinensis]
MSEVSCPHIHNQIPDRFYSSSSSIRVLPLFLSKTMSLAGHQTAIIRMKNEEGDQEQDDLAPSGTFPWRIENFSNLKFGKYASKIFTIGGIKWRVYMFLTDDDKSLGKRLALYLGVANAPSLPPGWTLFAHFRLTLVNQLDINKSVTKPTRGIQCTECRVKFDADNPDWGFKAFMPLSELYECSAGYLLNDICIVEAQVDVPLMIEDQGSNVSVTTKSSRKENERLEQNVNPMQAPDSSPATKAAYIELIPPLQDAPGSGNSAKSSTVPSAVQEVAEVPTNPTGKLIDFMGFGKIESAFVPLLEKVCSVHPSLIECQRRRGRSITQCAFQTLGEFLHFLKTTKIKDMTQETYEHLQTLWEDLEIFKFDLAWLEPHVQSALAMKKLLEKARKVKRMREDVEGLVNEQKRRTLALTVTEMDLEAAKKELSKEEEGFTEIDMETELGYGMP